MRVITAYPTTCAPSCIGIRFPTHRQCGYASGERNVIVPRADAPGGTEQWQRVCAFFFQNIIEDGTDVIATADDPAKTAPEFWYRLTCACPFSVRTLKE